MIWLVHLQAGDDGELNDDHIFQWFQTVPGTYHHDLCRESPPHANLRYEPESIAFAQRMQLERSKLPINIRDDELPPIPLAPYTPLTQRQVLTLQRQLPNSVLATLAGDMNDYEQLAPFQVRETADFGDWLRRCRSMLSDESVEHSSE
jgi:hypothetical protein